MANIYPIFVQSSRELTKALGRTVIVITDEQLVSDTKKKFKLPAKTPFITTSKSEVHSLKAKLGDFLCKYTSILGIDKIDGLSDYKYIETESKNNMLLVKCKGKNKIMADDKICYEKLK